MARQTKVQQFRDNATDQEWIELRDFYNGLKGNVSQKNESFAKEYGFSYQAVKPDLEQRGLIEIKKKKEDPVDKKFVIDDITEDKPSISRSVTLDEDIYRRLQELEKSKRQYTKKAILNKLLDEALGSYGY